VPGSRMSRIWSYLQRGSPARPVCFVVEMKHQLSRRYGLDREISRLLTILRHLPRRRNRLSTTNEKLEAMKTKDPATRSAKAENLAGLPKIVSAVEWRKASEKLLAKEKAATHARDALAAERRRMPVVKIDKSYVFSGPGGKVRLLDLFEGHRQLVLYHFMFAPDVDGWPTAGCPGCSMFVDQVGNLAHLHARDTSLCLVSRAPLAKIQRYRKRMGWSIPWVSSADSDFNVDFGVTTREGETFGLSIFLRDGDDIYRSYFTSGRGVEALGSVWTFLDLTPLGRQEEWEDSPAGWPQTPPYEWWRRHDEYE
jgi:predicted dithiol-disulfide oxidoreductase (DUF899 family)